MQINRDEKRTEKIDLRLRPSELAALKALAREQDRSVGAEVRAALNSWFMLAWLDPPATEARRIVRDET